jgi:hypothetical protein
LFGLPSSVSYADIRENGLLELHVGEEVGEESYMHCFWIEAYHILLRAKADDGSAN